MSSSDSSSLSFEDLYKKTDYLVGKIEKSKDPPLTALNILNAYMAELHAKCEKNNPKHVNSIESLQDRIDKFRRK